MALAFRGAEFLEKWAAGKERELRGAMSAVLQRAMFELYSAGWKGLKQGRLGLKPLSKYRNISRDPSYRGWLQRRRQIYGAGARNPLGSISTGIIYRMDKETLTAQVGFMGSGGGFRGGVDWQVPIARKSASGYTWAYSPDARERLHRMGIHLRQETTSAQVPARDIIGALADRHGRQVLENMKRNFDIKKEGGRF